MTLTAAGSSTGTGELALFYPASATAPSNPADAWVRDAVGARAASVAGAGTTRVVSGAGASAAPASSSWGLGIDRYGNRVFGIWGRWRSALLAGVDVELGRVGKPRRLRPPRTQLVHK